MSCVLVIPGNAAGSAAGYSREFNNTPGLQKTKAGFFQKPAKLFCYFAITDSSGPMPVLQTG